MSVFKIVLFGIVAAFCAFAVRDIRSDVSVIIGIASGIIVLIMIIGMVTGIGNEIKSFFGKYGNIVEPVKSVVKIVVIGFIGDLSCSVIEDCGQKSLSDKVSLAVKIIIISKILPVIKRLFEIIGEIL